MLPTILLTAEEAIKAGSVADAGSGNRNGRDADSGCDQGDPADRLAQRMLTGVMLAVARAAGETAPLLFTALFSDFWMSRTTLFSYPRP